MGVVQNNQVVMTLGEFIRKVLKRAKMTHGKFYDNVGIGKPYFYDVLAGRMPPPPPEVQYRMLQALELTPQEQMEFLDLAAEGRDEIPADIAEMILNNRDKMMEIRGAIRTVLEKK